MNSTAALPYHIGSAEADAVRVRDLSGETLLDIVAQCCVRGQLARLWPPSRPIGVPLRGARSIIEAPAPRGGIARSEEHTSELQSLMRISYAVFCLKKKEHDICCKTHKYLLTPILVYLPPPAMKARRT